MTSSKLILIIFFSYWGLFASELHAQNKLDSITGIATIEEIVASDKLFGIHINRYEPDKEVIKFLQSYSDSVTINVFFGTWCRESKKNLPGLIKTFQASEPSAFTINYIGVDAQKKVPKSFLKMFNIKYIPSIVVLKGKEEIGRIEEAPQKLIEIELVDILKKDKEKF